ncbi:MAG: type II toxin-antitoxin system RelE/ParE family toxin [Hyphomonadaceae bacterium]|nr:type II toxin-antitoxin system RelE/ParE family toxin [Hyphomonadaceae bacterium]
MTTKAPKPIVFLGGSLGDLRAFPAAARRMAGFQLDRVQHGADPADWKPMSDIGAGTHEIRVRDAEGAFRVIYVVKLADAVYVLHCFQKKSQRTSKQGIDLAKGRYKQLLQDLKS